MQCNFAGGDSGLNLLTNSNVDVAPCSSERVLMIPRNICSSEPILLPMLKLLEELNRDDIYKLNCDCSFILAN